MPFEISRTLAENVMIYFAVASAVTFLLFAVDKARAKAGLWRIKEGTLLLFAAIGGATGALAAMLLIRHKTRKPKFFITVPVLFAVQLAVAGILWFLSA